MDMGEMETVEMSQSVSEARPPALHTGNYGRPASSPTWEKLKGAGALGLVIAVAATGFAVGRSSHKAHAGSPQVQLTAKTSVPAAPGAQVTVTGSATVQGVPNTVSFEIGVHTTARSATAALRINDSKVNKLEASLRAHGVTKAEMQTSQLDIYANTGKHGAITSFSADNDLAVTMGDVAKAGAALDAASRVVGNDVNLNGISFSISNTSSLLATAREQAMRNARAAASQLAAAAGVTLGPVVRITDQSSSPPIYFASPLSLARATASVPLQAGTQTISDQVSVVYGLGS